MDKSSFWEARWASDNFSPKWANRGVAPEIVEAVETGWFPSVGPVLDIGCGLGEIAAWFARRGHPVLGFDIAASAIQRARETHAPLPPNLEFMTHDACGDPLPSRQYRILIDRGCLHAIRPKLVVTYTRNIASAAAPGARMLVFVRAFRHGRPFADKWETEMHLTFVRNAYEGKFDVVRYAPTYMGRQSTLPGLAFWLVASPGVADVQPIR